jgi:hypothetical protein
MVEPEYGTCCFSDNVIVLVLALKVKLEEVTFVPFMYKLTFLVELSV